MERLHKKATPNIILSDDALKEGRMAIITTSVRCYAGGPSQCNK